MPWLNCSVSRCHLEKAVRGFWWQTVLTFWTDLSKPRNGRCLWTVSKNWTTYYFNTGKKLKKYVYQWSLIGVDTNFQLNQTCCECRGVGGGVKWLLRNTTYGLRFYQYLLKRNILLSSISIKLNVRWNPISTINILYWY